MTNEQGRKFYIRREDSLEGLCELRRKGARAPAVSTAIVNMPQVPSVGVKVCAPGVDGVMPWSEQLRLPRPSEPLSLGTCYPEQGLVCGNSFVWM